MTVIHLGVQTHDIVVHLLVLGLSTFRIEKNINSGGKHDEGVLHTSLSIMNP